VKALAKREILDTQQCAAYLHRSAGAVRNLVMRRQIPYRKQAGRLLFFVDEIDAWLNEAPGLSLDELRKNN